MDVNFIHFGSPERDFEVSSALRRINDFYWKFIEKTGAAGVNNIDQELFLIKIDQNSVMPLRLPRPLWENKKPEYDFHARHGAEQIIASGTAPIS